MSRTIVSIAVAVALMWSATALAEPRFAVRQGMRCMDCHINRTGGGMRTPYGVSFSQTDLSATRLQGVFDPYAGDNLAFGANLRLVNRTVFKARTELNGVERRSGSSNSFDITEGNLYLRYEAIPDRMTVYLDETVTPEAASSREAFVMIQQLPYDGYLKAGRFLLPFGLRIPDDSAFIREQTGFTYANADLGVEVGIAPGPLTCSLAVTNGSLGGNDPNHEKQVTAQAAVVSDHARAGASFAWNDTSSADFDFQTFTAGGHIGGKFGRLLMLAEVDWIRGVGDPETFDQLAVYVETNFEARKALYLRFVFEAFDPLTSLDENERDRFAWAVSWFPIQMFEARAEFRLNRDIPQRVSGNANELMFELHGFL